MSHELETHANGQTAFVGREDAWHQLGNTLNRAFTAEEAMTEGLLGDWNVRKVPMFIKDPKTGSDLEMPMRNAVIRDNPVTKGKVDVLGDVGHNYKIIQNEAHAELLNTLVDESGAHFETAGSLHGGSMVFITMELPGHINVGGVDPVKNYLAAVNTHDGSMSLTLIVTPVQVVCKNTLNLAFQNNKNMFRIRHTSGADKALYTQAREALDLTFDYLDGFQEEAEKLINTTMTSAAFEQILREEFGVPDDASNHAITRSENKIEEIQRLFEESNTVAAKRDTAWGGLSALTEWADHYSLTRGSDNPDAARSQRALLDPTFKNRALKMMLATV